MIRTDSKTELDMAELYKKGKSMHEIAKTFNVSPATVCMHLKKYIPVSERRKRQFKLQKTNEKMLAEMKKMYEEGFSSISIGNKFGLDPATVLHHLKRMNVAVEGKYNPRIDDAMLEKISQTYKETGSILKTAEKFGLHPSSVHYRLSRLGTVRTNKINQKIARQKYEMLTEILVQLFGAMGYSIRDVQKRYNGHGPDMIIENDKESILVEHKATVKRSMYWQHAIEEVKSNLPKYNVSRAIVITTAKKPRGFKEQGTEIIFFDDLQRLLKENKLHDSIPKIKFISNTPSV